MTLTIKIKMDNAAFDPVDGYGPREAARVIRVAAEWAEHGREIGDSVNLRDVNGNNVGEAKVTRC